MVFLDELLSYNCEYQEFALIDHNKIEHEQSLTIGNDCHAKVTIVYDHHVDTKFYPQEQLRDYQVKFIGSACTILV